MQEISSSKEPFSKCLPILKKSYADEKITFWVQVSSSSTIWCSAQIWKDKINVYEFIV